MGYSSLSEKNETISKAEPKGLLMARKDTGLADVFTSYLGTEGFSVHVAECQAGIGEAYAELSSKPYDFVLVTNSGLEPRHIPEALLGVKTGFPGVRVIVLSGWHPSEFVQRFTEYGIDGFFPLPLKLRASQRPTRSLWGDADFLKQIIKKSEAVAVLLLKELGLYADK